MLKLINNLNITRKFIFFLVLIGVIPLLTAGLVAYQSAKQSLVEQALVEQTAVLAGLKDNIVLIQEQVESLLANISGVETITNALLQPQSEITNYEQLATEVQVGYILNGYLNIKGLVSIHIIGELGAHYQVGDTLDKKIKPTVRDKIRKESMESGAQAYWLGVSENINERSNQKRVLTVAQTIYFTDRSTLERRPIGTLVVNYSIEQLAKRFTQLADAARYYLFDKNGQYIYHPDLADGVQPTKRSMLHSMPVPDQHRRVETPEGHIYQTYLPIERSDWLLLSDVSETFLLKKVDFIRNTTFAIITISLVFIGFIAFYFSNSLIKPIKHITNSLKQLKEGDTEVKKLPVQGRDEISQLVRWFNQFLDELHKRYESEKALRASDERYELVATATNEGIWEINRETGDIYISDRFKAIAGYAPNELNASLSVFDQLVHPEDRDRILAKFKEFFRSNETSIKCELRFVQPNGDSVYVSNSCQAVRNSDGKVIRMVGSVQDISLQKRIEGRLKHDASHDPLTGLYNRTWMLNRISRELDKCKHYPEREFALLFIDLDNFKQLNDTLGHSYGDLLLIEVSKRIETCIRPGDALARLGGDEFLVLLADITTNDALQVTERLIQMTSEPYKLHLHDHISHSSIGLAFSKTGYNTAEEIVRDADTAMYQAKSAGRGRYEIFGNEMRNILLERTSIENDLNKALELGQFEMFYQPIQSLKSEQTVGFEGLIRWNHPDREISPDIFIPLAEEIGLIHTLGNWIITEVMKQVSQWDAKYNLPADFRIAVNISPKQFGEDGLIDYMKSTMSKYNINTRHIAIEITESTIFIDKAAVLISLQQLKEQSVGVHLDDFGTGYSSISYLSAFPIDAIKIDQSFISKMLDGKREARLINILILMAGELEIKVIAEGVETLEQYQHLKKHLCDFAQGNYISKPLSAKLAGELLDNSYPKKTIEK